MSVDWRADRDRLIRELKDKPCADCQLSYPHYVMQFDHLDGAKKRFNISQGRYVNLGKLRAEIAKCDVVCANCHAARTWRRAEEARARKRAS